MSGFLGGYVVAMPLLGAYSDARGRLPVYAAALAVFSAGSILTATAPALPWLVAGRAVQGLGGGALVPLTLALAADLYPDRGRHVALGAVSAVQEAGSLFGPVYGAGLAALVGDWRGLFWLNLPLSLLLAGAILAARRRSRTSRAPAVAGRPGRSIDWPGALLLGAGLGLLVASLYPDDPARRPVNALWLPLGLAAAGALAAFGWRQARVLAPLVDRRLLGDRSFAGAMTANLLTGVALMVALVDVPILARGVYGLSTLDSGLLVSRLLLGVPIGAAAGGLLSEHLGSRWTAAGGLLVCAGGFALMSGWGVDELRLAGVLATLELLAAGLGFGLVIAPLSAAVLAAAGPGSHGLAGSLVVVARTVGMIAGLASLTAFGLGRFAAIFAVRHCDSQAGPAGSLTARLRLFEDCVRGALLQEYREIFLVATGICVLAALVAALTLRPGTAPRVQAAPAPT